MSAYTVGDHPLRPSRMTFFLAVAIFSLVMSISPGPVNMVTLSIGANNGYRSAIPFVAGATIGFTLLLLLIGIGLGESVKNNPLFMNVLSVIGTAFICYVGYLIFTADGNVDVNEGNLPKFKHGFLLQWLNPKAWAACLAGVTLFSSTESVWPLASFVSIYCVICFIGIGSWAVFGDKALVFVRNQKRMRYFNRIMASMLIVVALYMLYQQLQGAGILFAIFPR